jgi:hypothetical protein
MKTLLLYNLILAAITAYVFVMCDGLWKFMGLFLLLLAATIKCEKIEKVK